MRRLLMLGLAMTALITAVALSRTESPKGEGASNPLQVSIDERNPWTTLKLNNNPNEFRFVVVSDRTGGHRAEIFSRAVKQLNLMQPEFVISVGDLVEGYADEKKEKDKERLAEEWREFDGYVRQLQMPFFYVPGNHDLSNVFEHKVWKERYGRTYYHFVYRDVLFLALSSEDEIPAAGDAKDDKKQTPKVGSYISQKQRDYVKKTLQDYPNVRWTMVFIHKPLWALPEIEKSGWLDVEKSLAEGGRKYSVFAGHVHRFQKFIRNGMNYYQLATTGGGSKLRGERYGEFDHFAWITMKAEGPTIANVMLDGIYPENMQKIRTDEKARPETTKRPNVYATTGKVLDSVGQPVANALVTFWAYDKKNKKYVHKADSLTDENGTYSLSTYTANDGAPAGEYNVTVIKRVPLFDESGKPGKNTLPEKYGKADTSGITVTVKGEANNLDIRLQ